MKTILRFLTVLALSVALGFAAYTFIQPISPEVSFSQTSYPAASAEGQVAPVLEAAGSARASGAPSSGAPAGAYRGGHPQGGSGGASSALFLALGKFIAIFAAIALLRFAVVKVASRKRRTA